MPNGLSISNHFISLFGINQGSLTKALMPYRGHICYCSS